MSVNRWHALGGDKVTPAEGKHFPARNGSYGTDVLLLDESKVNALIEAGHRELPCLTSSGGGMTALYDAGEASAERYIIASRGQIFCRTSIWRDALKTFIHRATEVRGEEVQKWMDTFNAARASGLDHYQARDVACGWVTLEKALNP